MATVRLVLTKPINASLQAKTLDTGAWDVIYFTRIENGKQVGDIERLGRCVNIETAVGDYYSEELWDGIDGDDANWGVYLNNTKTEDSGAVKITNIDSNNGGYMFLRDSNDLSTNLTIGATYSLTAVSKVDTGSVTWTVRDGGSPFVDYNATTTTSTSYEDVVINFTANHAENVNLYSDELSSSTWIKNISLKQVVTVGSNQYLVDVEVDSTAQTPNDGDFIFFGKENKVNISGVRGYFSEVKMNNDSNGPAKLFSVGSEIAQSSK